MVFSAPVHQDPMLIIEIVDEAWAAETLPIEDVVVAQAEMANLEEEDPNASQEDCDADKWNDLALDEFTSHISAQTYSSNVHSNVVIQRGTQNQ